MPFPGGEPRLGRPQMHRRRHARGCRDCEARRVGLVAQIIEVELGDLAALHEISSHVLLAVSFLLHHRVVDIFTGAGYERDLFDLVFDIDQFFQRVRCRKLSFGDE